MCLWVGVCVCALRLCVYGCVCATVAYEHENSPIMVPITLQRISRLNMKTHRYKSKNLFFQTSDENVESESEFS